MSARWTDVSTLIVPHAKNALTLFRRTSHTPPTALITSRQIDLAPCQPRRTPSLPIHLHLGVDKSAAHSLHQLHRACGWSRLSCEHCAWLNLDVNILRERASKPFSNVRSIDDLNWLQLRSKLDSREADHNPVKLKASMYQNTKDSLSMACRRLESFEKLFSFLQETPVRGLHRILHNAGTLGWSAEHTLEKCRLAVAGKYTPGTFFNWEMDVGMLDGKYLSISSAVDCSIGETSRTASSEVDLESAAFKLTDPFAGLSTEEILARKAPAPLVPFQMHSAFARIESASEKCVHKSSALWILFDLFLKFKEARDRLYRVRGFSGGGVIGWARQGMEGATVSSETHFQLGQLFITLLSHNGVDIGLAVVKATSIKDRRSSKAKSISAVPRRELYLATAPYIVFGQVLSLVPLATTWEVGTSLAWVWDETFVFFSLAKKKVGSESIACGGNLQISVSPRLIEPFAKYGHEIATSELPDIHLNRKKTWYFPDADLRMVWSRLWTCVIEDEHLHNKFPRFTGIVHGTFPYSMRSTNELPGVIYSQSVTHSIVVNTFRDAGACNICGKTVKEETCQNHVGRHILMKILGVFDPNANPEVSTHYPCGFCSRTGNHCSVKIDGGKAHSDCPSLYAFCIWSATTMSQAKPCMNVLIRCPIINCTEIHWKYNFPQHLHNKHDLRAADPLSSFLSLLPVSRQEQLALGIPPEKLIDWLASQVHSERPPESASDSVDEPASVSPIASNVSPSRRRALSHASGKENINPHLISPGKRRRVA
ncbi:hypothetical protein C8F01DRAFT_1345778 [Mycena amicta]|nr:hypothetical protein C8F01DRAFT_1345778 [Mycena amicta]